ncbi:hypothetical protein KR018_001389 [Drosophila ironensis]|nr:hypothetical protein KR018_001389 [Drosophila ironensis]
MNCRDRKFWTEFLLLYQSLPVLWKVRSPEYSNRNLKAAGYECLVRKLSEVEPEADRALVVRKINSFRTNFRRDVRRRDNCLALGEPFESTLWYFDLLSFLVGQEEDTRSPTAGASGQRKRIAPTAIEADEEEPLKSPEFYLPADHNISCASPYGPPAPRSTCCSKLSESEALSQTWANQFQELSQGQRILARKLISDILYYGCMEQLQPSHINQVHQLVNRESPENNEVERVSASTDAI